MKNGGLHVAIIMDGNGRWAARRGWPRAAGHRAGAEAVRRTVQAAPKLGVRALTLYAFSADNWRRPPEEVAALMELMEAYLLRESTECVKNGVRLNIIGRRDRLAPRLVAAIESAEQATAAASGLLVRIAVDYSGRDAILYAAARLARSGERAGRSRFAELLAEATNAVSPAADVDLLIRTSGEQRLSDFLLWECAYAELLFVPKMWPDFTAADLEQALESFHSRQRRYGGLAA